MDLHNQNESSSPLELQNYVPSLTAHDDEVKDDRNSELENSPKEEFWKLRRAEIDNASDIRSQHPFPLARIRRIAKSNGKVERIGADATVLLAKACEFFVMELTSRAWCNKEGKSKCLTLQHWDIGRALTGSNRMSFLDHIVRANSQKEAMRHLKETMFPPAHPLHLQNLNPPKELNLFKEADSHLGNPMDAMSMNPGSLVGNQEILQLFSPSTSSMPLSDKPGSNEEASEGSGWMDS